MRQSLLQLGIFVLSTLLACDAGASIWTEQTGGLPSDVGFLRDVFFVDANMGWTVGRTSMGAFGDEQRILKTFDGGVTWLDQLAPGNRGGSGAELITLFFADQTTGWAGGRGGSPGEQQIRPTTDSGTTWGTTGLGGSSNFVNDISATDQSNVWAVSSGRRGKVLYSSDGGSSFVEQGLAAANDEPTEVEMVNSSVGYTSSAFGDSSGNHGRVFKTTNGGGTWSTVLDEIDTHLFSLDFVSDTVGWAAGRNTAGGESPIIYHTLDGGISWDQQFLPTTVGHITDLEFVDALRGWALLPNQDQIWSTINGGDSWRLEFDGASNLSHLSALHFIDAEHGWAVGALHDGDVVEEGRVYKYTPGGGPFLLDPVPEPSTVAIWSLLGLVGAGVQMRRKRRALMTASN